MRLLELWYDGYLLFIRDGQYTVLCFAALFVLWFIKKEGKNPLRDYGTAVLALLLFPPAAWLLMAYQTRFYDAVDLWLLLPQTALIAYVLTLSAEDISGQTVGEKKKKIGDGPAIAVCALLLLLCGTLSLFCPDHESSTGYFSEETRQVLSFANTKQGEVMLLAPDEIAGVARVYDGRILLPYGRSLFEPALSAYTYDDYGTFTELHGWVNGTLEGMEDPQVSEVLFSSCASMECHYLVFSKALCREAGFADALSAQEDYTKINETKNYVIYCLKP